MRPVDDCTPIPDGLEPAPGFKVPPAGSKGSLLGSVAGRQPSGDEADAIPIPSPGHALPWAERFVPQSLADLKAAAEGRRDWLWHARRSALGSADWRAGVWRRTRARSSEVPLRSNRHPVPCFECQW
jgi:hypothetical protein